MSNCKHLFSDRIGVRANPPKPCVTCLLDKIKRLEGEIIEACEDTMYQECHKEPEGSDYAGWFDTMGRSHRCTAGDRLVQLGKWERGPGGTGRRQWYRPIQGDDNRKDGER